MFSKTIFAAAAIAAATVLLAAPVPAFAQTHGKSTTGASTETGTSEENAACRRDTRRLCRHIKADEGNDAFLLCLQDHRASLSKKCKEALESHGL